MKIVYTGPRPSWSHNTKSGHLVFQLGKPVEVDESLGSILVTRSDFKRAEHVDPDADAAIVRARAEHDAQAKATTDAVAAGIARVKADAAVALKAAGG